ncbi:UNC-like C-terminal-domain-containing protein [Bisporella sp. PMI_857]|nr:UNC-like C-terminal-domain-containing protein [Bisporella sp. PMI_857]
MVLVCKSFLGSAAAAVLLSMPSRVNSVITTAPQPTLSSSLPATCEFRTINYITDTLPQLCGKSSWSSSNLTTPKRSAVTGKSGADVDGQPTENTTSTGPESSIAQSSPNPTATATPSTDSSAADEFKSSSAAAAPAESADELHEAPFLSFEEWKKQTLEKAGQNIPHTGNKRSGEKKRDSESISNNLDSLGEDGEMELDFGALKGRSGDDTPKSKEKTEQHDSKADASEQGREVQRNDQYRSRDAGKTCKERFSYASFDAGATVLKTHPGAKNTKAILIENKDSYMLSECATPNKFLIIELSEEIWIDTLVLASYEFFSSMIRAFRVSVSDKYPVKMEKWKDLGTYEARNSREIQAFLIENPQIWARYIRIEFLTHYGNEFYCPLSLVRVHGTRMLESWKETEAIDNGDDGDDDNPEERLVPDAIADALKEEQLKAELKEAKPALKDLGESSDDIIPTVKGNESPTLSRIETTASWSKPNIGEMLLSYNATKVAETCRITDSPIIPSRITAAQMIGTNSTIAPVHVTSTTPSPSGTGTPASPLTSSTSQVAEATTSDLTTYSSPSNVSSVVSSSRTSSEKRESIASITSSIASRFQNSTTTQKAKASTTSTVAPSLPTIQESFFKAVSRRLQLLETNSTLSLKYIEEQSKMLREAFSKVEKKHLQKTTSFLDTLNSTVLAELRGFRQQYDEIWQSTIISLEGQREESRREILAISARLNILADEVVFQKRMSIVQSVLLLLCLGLVIFSRVSGTQIDVPSLHSRARAVGFPFSPLGSPPQSPNYHHTSSIADGDEWLEPEDIRRSDSSRLSCSRSREQSPPTSISSYSTSDHTHTPLSGGYDHRGANGDYVSIRPEHSTLPFQSHRLRPGSASWSEGNDALDPVYTSTSPAQTPKKRKRRRTQQRNPLSNGIDGPSIADNGAERYLSGEHPSWHIGDHISRSRPTSPLLSPPPEEYELRSDIARKPLPALPTS